MSEDPEATPPKRPSSPTERLAQAANKIRQERTGQTAIGGMRNILLREGLAPGLTTQIIARAKPTLVGVEFLAQEGPDERVVRNILASEVSYESSVMETMQRAEQTLLNRHQLRWQESPRTSPYPAKRLGPGETEEQARERLARNEAAKKTWDEQVSRARHNDPAQVATSLFLAGKELQPQERTNLRRPLARLTSEVLDHSPRLQAIPSGQRDREFWIGVAEIAWLKIDQDRFQEAIKGEHALSQAVGLLEERLEEKSQSLSALYQTITKSPLVLGAIAQRPGQKVPGRKEVSRLLSQRQLPRVGVDGGKLIIDGRQFFGIAEATRQYITRLALLRALAGKEPLDPVVAENVAAGQKPWEAPQATL